jgi:hypothetical protein
MTEHIIKTRYGDVIPDAYMRTDDGPARKVTRPVVLLRCPGEANRHHNPEEFEPLTIHGVPYRIGCWYLYRADPADAPISENDRKHHTIGTSSWVRFDPDSHGADRYAPLARTDKIYPDEPTEAARKWARGELCENVVEWLDSDIGMAWLGEKMADSVRDIRARMESEAKEKRSEAGAIDAASEAMARLLGLPAD